MRNALYLIIITGLVAMSSCEREILPYVPYEAYTFASIDEKGGQWKPILISDVATINVASAADIQSQEYKDEINALKKIVDNATETDKEKARYWSQNPVVRWNEIARELAAKYNLPPAPNAAGVYVLPDPANPSQYPQFPFAHPPYASRAFAYLSAASFDALIVAWHHKTKNSRPAIHLSNADIPQLFPTSNIPSYPSDGAVIASVAKDILGAMFPLEKDFLLGKYNEALKSVQVAGLNTQSDIIAGEKLGSDVAKIFLSRASTDGMKSAQTPKAKSDSIRNAAFAKYGWAWENLEAPQRPVGIVPAFGNVKPWTISDISTVRPASPPAIGSKEFNEAADELIQLGKGLTSEQRRIANFWADGPTTYTPPGHWNKIATDLIVQNKYNPLRSARTLAYMNMAIQDAGISCWDAKYHYYYPRPINVIPEFKTHLGTPNFPGYTSGHSTFSAAGATVLGAIFPSEKSRLDALAKAASDSRIYGCIHFRFDCEVGLEVGKKVGQYAVDIAKNDGAN